MMLCRGNELHKTSRIETKAVHYQARRRFIDSDVYSEER